MGGQSEPTLSFSISPWRKQRWIEETDDGALYCVGNLFQLLYPLNRRGKLNCLRRYGRLPLKATLSAILRMKGRWGVENKTAVTTSRLVTPMRGATVNITKRNITVNRPRVGQSISPSFYGLLLVHPSHADPQAAWLDDKKDCHKFKAKPWPLAS